MKPSRFTKRTSRRVRAALACGVLLGTGAIGTTALWSTSAATVSGKFTTTALEIKANTVKEHNFAFSGPVYPGYTTTPTVINVQNTGATAFRYSVSVSSSSSLGRSMTLKMTANSTCTGTSIVSAQPIPASPVLFAGNRGPLTAGTGVEALCVQLTMPPSGVPQTVAGTSGTVLFTFDATSA
ncbi:hypothetical protein L5G32_14140 [Gordonia sp. HY002]|uniref:hypothetical protein n=1 Tax=Gordonia zhenghanii TaxID=2911516 RepID=UPI001EF012E0|nr:hypothetical protein [Gordonia zhenghanii]MCF8571408.1 hypothetical protein [Gordonia zhenghanii]MCF8606746.1 hypothetical protein [Gordonia zhenghanii]